MIDDMIKSQKLHDAATKAMAELGVPPSARNYMIWYHDAAGDHTDLSQMLRRLVAKGEPFTAEICEQIYERFFGSDQRTKAIDEACSKLEQTMDRVLLQISDVGKGSKSFGQSLSEFKGHLGHSSELREVRHLVEDVLTETQQMQENTIALESALASSTREIAELNKDLALKTHQAQTDGLTGIANRRRLEAEFVAASAEGRETGEPLCLLMIDVDHFKTFNDTHGHQIGDQVLKLVAKTMTKCVKGVDIVGRYGGEEFAVILPRTNLDGAVVVGNQIREAIMRSRIRKRSTGEDIGNITLSGGCALYEPGERFSDVVERADEALYHAKQAGRNQIKIAASPHQSAVA